MNKEKSFVSAVIYVYNAEDRIKYFLTNIIEFYKENFEHSEIICVNDASTDQSGNLIKQLAEEVSGTTITLINLSYFHGLESAMNAGVDLAIGDFVFEFDNTFMDYLTAEIMNVYKNSLKGYDIVSASAKGKQKWTSSVFYHVFNSFSGQKDKMKTESFRILSRRALNRIDSLNKTVPNRKILYLNCGLKTKNIEYDVAVSLKAKNDKREKSYRLDLAIDSFILFTNIGYKISLAFTFIMMLLTLGMAVYSLVIYFGSTPIEGWTTTVLFLSGAFFGLFAILTIVIKYLQILVDLIFKKKQYNFESVEKLTK